MKFNLDIYLGFILILLFFAALIFGSVAVYHLVDEHPAHQRDRLCREIGYNFYNGKQCVGKAE